jgi:Transposase IS66 family
MALLSFVESAPRAYRLKVGNADLFRNSTEPGTSPGQIHPQAFLGDYRGIVMSDGYTAWRTLERATHIGCMAHSRRRFVDALRARKKGGGPPEQALRFFDQLYRVERQARDGIPEGETQADCIRKRVGHPT